MISCRGFGEIDTHGDLNRGGVFFKIIPRSDDAKLNLKNKHVLGAKLA